LTMDIFPTVLDAAGVEAVPVAEGISFLPTLVGHVQEETRRDLYFVRREGGLAYGGKTIEALIRGDWKLIQDSPFKPLELYNLKSDPGETTNLTSQEPQVYQELSTALRRQIQQAGRIPWQEP
ncbi:sulfatase/phosphatase domain-containing protein, partial [Schlesneria sp.]|uniref:sulfatase/phosphatase domain-containing protein n=1 Tax=Schlesneria sp. TaxID=2762018 RepID=UPI002EEF31AB